MDAGYFRLDWRIFAALREAGREGPPSVSAGMARLARAGVLAAVPLGPVRWIDVDTGHERGRAERLFARAAPALVGG